MISEEVNILLALTIPAYLPISRSVLGLISNLLLEISISIL